MGQGQQTLQVWLEVLNCPAWAPVSEFLPPHEERGEEGDECPLPLKPWHSWSPGGEGYVLIPQTPLWLGPGPKSVTVWPVHLTSVWVVCHTYPSRNLMPPACASVWRTSSWRGRVACLHHGARQPHHSQAAVGGGRVSPPVPGFSGRRASWSQLHLSRTETMRRASQPRILLLSTPMLQPTSCFSPSKWCWGGGF